MCKAFQREYDHLSIHIFGDSFIPTGGLVFSTGFGHPNLLGWHRRNIRGQSQMCCISLAYLSYMISTYKRAGKFNQTFVEEEKENDSRLTYSTLCHHDEINSGTFQHHKCWKPVKMYTVPTLNHPSYTLLSRHYF